MLVNQSNRLYTDIGDFCFLARDIQDYISLKYMLKDYSFVPLVSFTELSSVDTYQITCESGFTSLLSGSYSYHKDKDATGIISSIKVDDNILLAGAFPDVDSYALVRVPHSLCELGYFNITEGVVEILAAAVYYGSKTDNSIIIKDINESLLSDEAVLFVKNFGGTVFKKVQGDTTTFYIKIGNQELVDFIKMDIDILLYFIGASPRSVIKSFYKIERSVAKDKNVISWGWAAAQHQQILLSRFGLMGKIVGKDLVFNDFDLSEVKPISERYSNSIQVNEGLSVYADRVVKVEKKSEATLNLLLDSDSNSKLILDNIF